MIPTHFGHFVMESLCIELLPWHQVIAGRVLFGCFVANTITTSTLGSSKTSTPGNIPKLADTAPATCLDNGGIIHQALAAAGFNVDYFRPHSSRLWVRDVSLAKVLGVMEYSMHVEAELERVRTQGESQLQERADA